jgi:hypothetical protein
MAMKGLWVGSEVKPWLGNGSVGEIAARKEAKMWI